jgi:hypothetical protein
MNQLRTDQNRCVFTYSDLVRLSFFFSCSRGGRKLEPYTFSRAAKVIFVKGWHWGEVVRRKMLRWREAPDSTAMRAWSLIGEPQSGRFPHEGFENGRAQIIERWLQRAGEFHRRPDSDMQPSSTTRQRYTAVWPLAFTKVTSPLFEKSGLDDLMSSFPFRVTCPFPSSDPTPHQSRSPYPTQSRPRSPVTSSAHSTLLPTTDLPFGSCAACPQGSSAAELGARVAADQELCGKRKWSEAAKKKHSQACKDKSRLTLAEKLEMIRLFESPDENEHKSPKELAVMFGKSRMTISTVLRPESRAWYKQLVHGGVRGEAKRCKRSNHPEVERLVWEFLHKRQEPTTEPVSFCFVWRLIDHKIMCSNFTQSVSTYTLSPRSCLYTHTNRMVHMLVIYYDFEAIVEMAERITRDLKIENFKATNNWCTRFIQQHKIVMANPNTSATELSSTRVSSPVSFFQKDSASSSLHSMGATTLPAAQPVAVASDRDLPQIDADQTRSAGPAPGSCVWVTEILDEDRYRLTDSHRCAGGGLELYGRGVAGRDLLNEGVIKLKTDDKPHLLPPEKRASQGLDIPLRPPGASLGEAKL